MTAPRMSLSLIALVSMAVSLTTSCQSGGSTPIAPQPPTGPAAALGAIAAHPAYSESALALYTLRLDPATVSAESDLAAMREASANDDLYALSITNFLRRDSFKIRSVTRTADTLDVGYTFAHPFPAPADPAGTPNGSTNRADLGVAGRLLVLADVPAAAGNTYFSDRVANTALVANADAYYAPAGLLNLATTANTFPYKLLIDESGPEGNRVGVPNGGDPTGNFGTDGWTRAEFGANNDAWTGFGVLHQGQVAANMLSFNLSELGSGLDLTIAVLAKYNDPRGGLTSVEKRGNRLPPASADPTRFAYRMPHGALDVEKIVFAGESGGFVPNTITASTLRFQVTDWDTRATESAMTELSDEPDVTLVAPGSSGAPEFSVCIPGVIGDESYVETFAPIDLLDDDTAIGGDVDQDSGRPDDALYFERLVAKPAGSGQTSGTYTGMARADDLEPEALVVPLDGSTLAPLSTNLPTSTTYQAFTVEMAVSNQPPVVNATLGVGLQASCGTSPATFVLINLDAIVTDPDSDPITYTVVATPDVGAPVTVSGITGFPISNAATGPWVNPPVSSVAFQVWANDPFHTGTGGTPLPVATAPAPLTATLTPPAGWANVWGGTSAQVYDTTIAPDGSVFAAGYFQGNADLNPGPGTDAKTGFGNWDVFVSKFDPSGNYLWGKHWGGTGQDFAQSVAIDNAGNCYVGGRFEGLNIDFNPDAGVDQRSAVASYDAFAVSLDSSGAYRWSATWGGTGADWVFECGVDSLGTPSFVGRTSGTVDYDPGPGVVNMAGPGGDDSFLLQLVPATGAYSRALVMGNAVADNFYTMACDTSGGIYLSGSLQGTFDMDPGPGVVNRVSTFASNPYVLKLDAATLNYVWDAHFHVQIPVGLAHYGMAVDSQGDVYYTAGYASHPVSDVDPGPGVASLPILASGQDPFLVALNDDGTYKWHTWVTGNGTSADWGHDVATTTGRVYWVGDFGGSNVDFNPGAGVFPLTSAGGSDAFLASFDSASGSFINAGAIGSGGSELAYAVGAPDTCTVVWSGTSQGSLDYDPGPGTQTRPGVGSFNAWQSRLGANLTF